MLVVKLRFFFIINISVFFLSLEEIQAQKNVVRQDLFWVRLMVQSNLNKRFFLINELDHRRFFEQNTFHHTIQHSHLHFKIKSDLDVAIGQTFSWQNPQFPDANPKLQVPEIRPFQEINGSQNINKRLTFSSRIRIDERFVRKNNGLELLQGYNFNMRYRLRFQYLYKIGKMKNGTLKASNELMVNSGKNVNFFDQNRLYIAYEYNFSKKLSAEIGYLRWYQQRIQFDTYFQRDIIRLTVSPKINFGKN